MKLGGGVEVRVGVVDHLTLLDLLEVVAGVRKSRVPIVVKGQV